MNLYQKLVEIQKSVRSLAKDSYANSYQYVSGSKVLDAVRERMDQLGILLIPDVDKFENIRIDYQVKNGSKSEMLTKVDLTFTWIDAESGDKLPVKFGANGMNNWDKGFGSALTYAERYFLLKFFHIATDEDDVDALPPRGNEDALPKRAKGMDTPPPAPLSAPKSDKEMMHQGHAKWQAMLDSILAGKTTLEKVKERYFFPDADEIAAKEWLLTHQL